MEDLTPIKVDCPPWSFSTLALSQIPLRLMKRRRGRTDPTSKTITEREALTSRRRGGFIGQEVRRVRVPRGHWERRGTKKSRSDRIVEKKQEDVSWCRDNYPGRNFRETNRLNLREKMVLRPLGTRGTGIYLVLYLLSILLVKFLFISKTKSNF